MGFFPTSTEGYSFAAKHFLLNAQNTLKCCQECSQFPPPAPPCLVLSLWAVLPANKCKGKGGCSCCLWRSQAPGGSCWPLAQSPGCQQHLPISAPPDKIHTCQSALLEDNVSICMFYQTDQASNTQQVEEKWEQTENIGSETWKQWIFALTSFGTEWGSYLCPSEPGLTWMGFKRAKWKKL